MVELKAYIEEAVRDARAAARRLSGAVPLRLRGHAWAASGRRSMRHVLDEESAQGTTEYAILVGVLVVIAILAIIAFRDKVSSLWDAISQGINSL